MKPEQVLQAAITHAFLDRCDGACEEHRGECLPVFVENTEVPSTNSPYWYFSYCQEAREEDVRRGFKVTVQDVVQMYRVEDTRTPEQRAKQELGINVEDCER